MERPGKSHPQPKQNDPVGCSRQEEPGACCTPSASRREFLKLAGASAASLAAGQPMAAQGEGNLSADHFVPLDKKLDPQWLAALTDPGEPTWYTGKDLETIAMPIGGICAGQVYLAGDGRLVHWDVFNIRNFTGYGRECYNLGRKPAPVLAQGFAVRVRSGGRNTERVLDGEGFPEVRFCGEYPIGKVEYRDAALPVSISLEAFSPFIPLSASDSALPATVLEFTVENTTLESVDVCLSGWLENGVCRHAASGMYAVRRNRVSRGRSLHSVVGTAAPGKPPKDAREPIVLADFEGKDYGRWTAEGQAFGTGPAAGTLAGQQEVSGFRGRGLVNTYLGGNDALQGKLTSPEFTIERSFISFLVGGGKYEGETCMNLLVDEKVVRTVQGENKEKLTPYTWDVRDLAGKKARLEIVDRQSGGWGHINIDHIEMTDRPRPVADGTLEEQPDFGSMALALVMPTPEAVATASLPDGAPRETIFGETPSAEQAERPFGRSLVGAVAERFSLKPGEERVVRFVASWFFPNRGVRGTERGNCYASRFSSAAEVAAYVVENYRRLAGATRLWHDTWYDATLPRWLLDRLFSTVSTLATSTCQWWENGRFWAWEGVGCCHGTCTHVWNYEHAMARLFPELERSVREMQDYNPEAGFVAETGMVRFRGEGWKMWAGDGQAGTVLKAYREHQMSADSEFLKRNYKKICKSLEFLINQDQGNDDDNQPDGVLTGAQHNTYDINFFGANTMVGSLYLAALRAGEEMALEMGDKEFAGRCRRLFEAGSRHNVEELFGGEYFIQKVDLEKHPKAQYAGGCLSDQLFGEGWARQVGLGRIYTDETVLSTLRSIWKYNWAPDVGPQNAVHKPERWFASPGEPGLFTCTWPHSPHLPAGVRYKNEVWTGIEYQVAGHLAWEGMVREALAICRGVHDRYHPARHNPFNEVECGDHYARAMASYGVFLGLCGFEYHGPKAHIGFAPRINADRFRGAFVGAEGWGTLSQERTDGEQRNGIEVKQGRLRVKSLAFELPEGMEAKQATLRLAGKPVAADVELDDHRVRLVLQQPVTVERGQVLEIRMA